MAAPKVLLRGEQSEHEIGVVQSSMPAGAEGPPLHTHDFDEVFYVLDGEILVQLDAELDTVRAGKVAFAPRGVPHTLANHSHAPATFLIVFTPAGFEREFARRAAAQADEQPPAWAMRPIPAVTRVGPQIGEQERPALSTTTEKPLMTATDAPRFGVLLRSEQTDDHLGIVDITVPAGWGGPPLHHHDFDESFYLLEGELTFQLGDRLTTAGPRQLIFAPRGSRHTLANLSAAPARYVLICTPGTFERYFDGLQAQITDTQPPPEAFKPYPETIVVGPTIGERPE